MRAKVDTTGNTANRSRTPDALDQIFTSFHWSTLLSVRIYRCTLLRIDCSFIAELLIIPADLCRAPQLGCNNPGTRCPVISLLDHHSKSDPVASLGNAHHCALRSWNIASFFTLKQRRLYTVLPRSQLPDFHNLPQSF